MHIIKSRAKTILLYHVYLYVDSLEEIHDFRCVRRSYASL